MAQNHPTPDYHTLNPKSETNNKRKVQEEREKSLWEKRERKKKIGGEGDGWNGRKREREREKRHK